MKIYRIIFNAIGMIADIKNAAHANDSFCNFRVPETKISGVITAKATARCDYLFSAGLTSRPTKNLLQNKLIILLLLLSPFNGVQTFIIPGAMIDIGRAINSNIPIIHEPLHTVNQAAVLGFIISAHRGGK